MQYIVCCIVDSNGGIWPNVTNCRTSYQSNTSCYVRVIHLHLTRIMDSKNTKQPIPSEDTKLVIFICIKSFEIELYRMGNYLECLPYLNKIKICVNCGYSFPDIYIRWI